MHVLAIDIGSYSVKYVSSFVDRRKVSHVDMSEIILKDYLDDHQGFTIQEGQIGIVQEILDTVARPETRVIFQAENEMMTTRFLTLPVKNRKKAAMMLPFQLEEDIPYALSEIHYAHRLESLKTQHVAMVELSTRQAFENYYDVLKEKNALPNILTTEASAFENYFNQFPMAGPFCVLDIGHRTTKAYFFFNSRLLVTHTSYVGGQNINEMIAQTYQIDPDEAIFYKHQNAFMLTSSQYDGVEPSQRDFATAMDKVFQHLVSDFARWKIGFKVNFGLSVSHVFICGGSSNIKNISNYLTEKWDIKVSLLETFDKVEAEKLDLNPKNKSKFALVNMMSQGFKRKNRFINLLIGKFAQASAAELPLHSLAFIGVRVTALTAILAITLLMERLYIERDIQAVNVKLATVMRNEELRIPARLRRIVATDPRPVNEMLIKKQRSIRQEISTLQSAIEIQALSPLVTISQIAANSDATLIVFKSNDLGEIEATFSAEKLEALSALKEALERSTLRDISAQINNETLQLQVNAGI